MQIKIYKNRIISEDKSFVGYQNENHAEKLIFDIPEELSDYEKVICFSSQKGNFEDILQGNEYILTNSITKNRVVDMYLKFIKKIENDKVEVIKTSIMQLDFKDSFDTFEEIDEEKVDILDTLILETKEATERANSISEELENKVATDYYKGEKGDSYIITKEDYTKIEEDVKNDIKPTLDNNLKFAKDYTDNAIIKDFKDISYDQDTATFVFTRHDNTTFTVDLPIEQTVKNGYYDETKKELVLVLVSDQEIRIPASGLIDDYIGVDSATIQLSISADNKITASIKGGSITKTLLTTELQNEIDSKVNKTAFVYDTETETLSITI